jgi:predicted SnoaL-like aldol condensation-catalyzing enzyme
MNQLVFRFMTSLRKARTTMTNCFRSASLLLWLCLACPVSALAQVPVVPAADHGALLASPDPALARNKRLVYDFWREVFEAGHMELADKYMAETYIQHNPNVPTGRAAFVDFFSRFKKPNSIAPKVGAPLVAITAERDLVILTFVREMSDPKDPAKKYTTTWFDMFRVEAGKIAEHWDPAVKP